MSRARDNANLSPTIPDARMPNLTGDITTSEGAVATSITADAVGTDELANDVVINTSGAITTTGGMTVDGATVFNEASADVDFRVESNANANMLFVDGGANAVGINSAAPSQTLDIVGTGIELGSSRSAGTTKYGRMTVPLHTMTGTYDNMPIISGYNSGLTAAAVYIGGGWAGIGSASGISFFTSSDPKESTGSVAMDIDSGATVNTKASLLCSGNVYLRGVTTCQPLLVHKITHGGTSFNYDWTITDHGFSSAGGSIMVKASGWSSKYGMWLVQFQNDGGSGDLSTGAVSVSTITSSGFTMTASNPSGDILRLSFSGCHNNAHAWDSAIMWFR
jgi:hypothetical protein